MIDLKTIKRNIQFYSLYVSITAFYSLCLEPKCINMKICRTTEEGERTH